MVIFVQPVTLSINELLPTPVGPITAMTTSCGRGRDCDRVRAIYNGGEARYCERQAFNRITADGPARSAVLWSVDGATSIPASEKYRLAQ
jgi:hypothetical protein